MLVYRVIFYSASATDPTVSGHPMYLHRPGQGSGRLDNPTHYDCWYFAATPEGAVGETFGNLITWSNGMFKIPAHPRAKRALATYELPDDLNILDLDDAKALAERGLRPTQVISRNRATTQDWSLGIFREHRDAGGPKWDGVRWWSYHRPHWPIIGTWVRPGSPPFHSLVGVQALTVSHAAVQSASHTLQKPLLP